MVNGGKRWIEIEMGDICISSSSPPFAFLVSLLFEDIATIKPTLFNSVPRLFNRIHAAILQKTLYSGSAITAALFRRALEAKTQSVKATGSLTHAFWDRIIFNKIKNVLGGRVRMMISGSAVKKTRKNHFIQPYTPSIPLFSSHLLLPHLAHLC